MCLAIFKKPEATISEESLREGFISNNDGAGVAYVNNGKVVVSKGFMTFADFLLNYNRLVKANAKSPFLIHFRIRSMGDKTPSNTHPFTIPGGALIHNGTLDGTAAKYGDGPSDTFLFAQQYGAMLTYDRVDKYKKEWCDALSGNKVAILYDDGRHQILNESLGHWVDGVWYSNHSYRPRIVGTGMYGVMGMGMDDEEWEHEWKGYH